MSYILIIDDEHSIRELLSDVFSSAGYDVGVAESGLQGIRMVSARKPDLVVTDILMPDKEGLETILELKRSAPDLPIFAMSGGSLNGPIDVLGMARRFGAIRVYPKPFDPFDMLQAIQAQLGAA
jgi:DNA-binding NtrC family response regulator